jgi:O-antigen chain-terminating methyltransferase
MKKIEERVNNLSEKIALTEEDHLFDAMYVAFEDQFRGTREAIRERVRVYLPYIAKVRDVTGDALLLDIGCGRGEWLELLKENGYEANGIDVNRVMIQQCRQRDLPVIEADAVRYLKKQESDSFCAITGFHIVEHMPYRTLIQFFDEALRTLKPGGVAIFETPNPENLFVGACDFYYDPTHRKPLPPASLKFIAEQRGFVNVEILRLHKVKEPHYLCQESIDEVLHRVNMEQDYSIIGYKR